MNDLKAEYKAKYVKRLQDDLTFYARWCLKIKTKGGLIEPFIFNRAQQYLHRKVEEQKMRTGKVRILIDKGRQEGMSTYIAGRFYHGTTTRAGTATFILSHQSDTTDKLYGMVERFHKHVPNPVKADTDVANRRRMVFAGIESEYFVGTAGNEEVGRGGTIQCLHASECAFYPASAGFSAGLLQSVPDAPGTEVFLESTANGLDSLFYPMAMNALEGRGDYELIFIPWFWQQEYRRVPPIGFIPSEEEVKLMKTYNLDIQQICWRRNKIFELKELKFMQEYPNSIEESFMVSGDSLIPQLQVAAARKSAVKDNYSPLIIGVDPNEARGQVGIVWRRGRQILKTQIIEGKGPMELVSYLASIIDNDSPAKMFLDNGNGYAVIDRLIELGYGKICIGIDFGGGATEEALYLNHRAEMGCLLAQWFINGGVSIPDEDLFQKHLCCVPRQLRTSSGKMKLESKDKIIQDTLIDPHLFDAAALTFAMPVRAEGLPGRASGVRKAQARVSTLKTGQRRAQFERGNMDNASVSATVAV